MLVSISYIEASLADDCAMTSVTACASAPPRKLMPAMPPTMLSSTLHINIWVSPTSATPSILPSISSMGLQLLTITSTMRLLFSSITLFIIIEPYIITNIYDASESITPITMASSVDDVCSSPSSLHLMERTSTSILHSLSILSSPSMP